LLLALEDEPEDALDRGVGVTELADQAPPREYEDAVRALDELLEEVDPRVERADPASAVETGGSGLGYFCRSTPRASARPM
jgi:hypothetical protein